VAPELRPRLKWPNDLLLDDRKAAGILCEGVGDAVVAGVGVNVRQRLADFPDGLRPRAGSLEMASGRPVSRAALAGALLAELGALLARPAIRLEGALADEVARLDALAGREVEVAGVRGVCQGIDAAGRLRLEVAPGEVRAVVAGSVDLLP